MPFIITHDYITRKGEESYAVGINTFQADTPQKLKAAKAEAKLHGSKFKLLDDDGNHYYTGYVIEDDDDYEDDLEEVFTWGQYYAGTAQLWIEQEYDGKYPQLWEDHQTLTVGQLGWHYTI